MEHEILLYVGQVGLGWGWCGRGWGQIILNVSSLCFMTYNNSPTSDSKSTVPVGER